MEEELLLLEAQNKQRQPKRFAVREIFRNRKSQGDGYNLLQEMRLRDPEYFFNYTRLDLEGFEKLLGMVGPIIKKRHIVTAISPVQRLAMTLRYLANGNSMVDLGLNYRCHKSTVSIIIRETTCVIADVLEEGYLSPPSNAEEWLDIVEEFEQQWQMPHCLGAIDGKHVVVQAFQASESLYFNYKKQFSVVLLAVVDADYNFLIVDIGAEGSMGDAATLANSEFGKRLKNGTLHLPPPRRLARRDQVMPFYFVGDAAFPLMENLFKPYGGKNCSHKQRVFDYRLSRARRVVENAVGILASRWRIFRRPICALPDTVDSIIRATVSLHNYINRERPKVKHRYMPPNFVDTELDVDGCVQTQNGAWRDEVDLDQGAFRPCPVLGGENAKRSLFQMRNEMKDYLNTEFKLPWQDETVKKGFWGSK